MPELPEVETWRRLAEKNIRGNVISSVYSPHENTMFDNCSGPTFASTLKGKRIEAIHRKGKHLWMELNERPYPYFHFGMSGSFHIYNDIKERPRYLKAELRMDNGKRLGFNCIRKIGRIRLYEDPTIVPPISKLGFDPLLNMAGINYFEDFLTKRKAPIKSLLLNQTFAAGVGNWIADEILFQAKVNPFKKGCELSKPEMKALHTKMKSIIKRAVENEADETRFPKNWLFLHRWGKAKEAKTAQGNLYSLIPLAAGLALGYQVYKTNNGDFVNYFGCLLNFLINQIDPLIEKRN